MGGIARAAAEQEAEEAQATGPTTPKGRQLRPWNEGILAVLHDEGGFSWDDVNFICAAVNDEIDEEVDRLVAEAAALREAPDQRRASLLRNALVVAALAWGEARRHDETAEATLFEAVAAYAALATEGEPPVPEPCDCGHAWSGHGPTGTSAQGCWADGKAKGGVCGCRKGRVPEPRP